MSRVFHVTFKNCEYNSRMRIASVSALTPFKATWRKTRELGTIIQGLPLD